MSKLHFVYLQAICLPFMVMLQCASAMPTNETMQQKKSEVLPPLEWFGVPRGGDPNDEAFYDLIYDNNACPAGGLRASGLKNFAHFGTILKVLKNNNGTEECIRECFSTPQCKSINVFVKRKHLCELKADDQFDDPFKLVNTQNVIYYDRIQCVNN